MHTGTLHIYVAFDWGEEVNLDLARRLVPAGVQALPRRRRTPSSIGYRPPPLLYGLEPVALQLAEIGAWQASAEATVFDFAAVSVALHVPFQLSAAQLIQLADWLADSAPLVQAAGTALAPLHQQLLPALTRPLWRTDFWEEYFVFQLAPPAPNLQTDAAWLAGLVHLEAAALSGEEIAEALRLHLGYSPEDLVIPDWAAAVVIDRDCDETLQIIEFANLQLLEFRYIDDRLDSSLADAYKLVNPLNSAWLPFWRSPARALRTLGSLKVEANGLFERTENVLKLVGDQYLSRVYRLLAARFHLDEWEQNIQRKLEVAEGVYQVVADQTDTYRTEFLEIVVIGLIVIEIFLAIFGH